LIHTIPHRREIRSSSFIWEVHPSKVAPSGPMWVHAALDQAVAIEHRIGTVLAVPQAADALPAAARKDAHAVGEEQAGQNRRVRTHRR
jgi:hypothetical protein